jgi:hypothetical protein
MPPLSRLLKSQQHGQGALKLVETPARLQFYTNTGSLWDPRGFAVSGSYNADGNYVQMRLHGSQSYTLHFCSGAMFVDTPRDSFGSPEQSGFGQGHIFHQVVQLASASSVPPGVAIGVGLLNGHPSGSTPTGLFAGIVNNVTGGNGNKVFVQRVLAGVYSAPTLCSADVSEIRQMLTHIAPLTVTQYTAFTAVGLNSTSSVPGSAGSSMASDDALTAVWTGLNTVIYGAYYHGPSMNTAVTSSITGAFGDITQHIGDFPGSNF